MPTTPPVDATKNDPRETKNGHQPSRLHLSIEHYAELYDGNFWHEIPQVYAGLEYEPDPNLDTVIILLGSSGAGKDSTMDPILEAGYMKHAVTATSRKRKWKVSPTIQGEQKDQLEEQLKALTGEEYLDTVDRLEAEGRLVEVEPRNKYIWMRPRRANESTEEYKDALITEYGLVESDAHYGNVYGLPASSLQRVVDNGQLPLIRTEVNGALTLTNALRGRFNVLVITVMPDSNADVRQRLLGRDGASSDTRDKIEQRIAEDEEKLLLFPLVTHFYIHNSAQDINGRPGLEVARNSLKQLLVELGLVNLN